MFESVSRKLSIGMGFVGLTILFLVIALHAHKNIIDADTWLHIKSGEYIVHHGIPSTDIYSFSLVEEKWIDHQWLWQVILYNVRQAFGDWGLISLQALLTLSIFLILLLAGYSRDRVFLVALLLFMGILLDPSRSLMRPDMVSLWFSLVYVIILWSLVNKSWTLYALFALQILWTNMHGFFILGPLVTLLMLLSESIKRHIPLPYEWNKVGRLNDKEYHRLKKIVAVLIVACFINPYFVDGFLYPIRIMLDATAESKFFYSYIGELHRTLPINMLMNFTSQPVYKFLIVFSSIGFVLNRRRIDLRVLILWLIFLGFSWVASRNLIFFAPAAYLSLIVNLSSMRLKGASALSRYWHKFKHPLNVFLQLGLIVSIGCHGWKMVQGSEYFDLARLKIQNSYGQLSDQRFPRRLMDFLLKHNIQGNFFNNLETGYYMMIAHYPDIKVYIDGRTEVFGADFFKKYVAIWKEGRWDIFEEQVNRFNINGAILISTNRPLSVKFLKQMYSHPEWKLIYFDYDGVVFLRDIPSNRDKIARLAVDLTRWRTNPADVKLLHYPIYVRAYYNRAMTLKNLGLYEQAEKEVVEALQIDPTHVQAIILKAQICKSTGRAKEALELFDLVSRYKPNSNEVMMEKVLVYESISDYDNVLLLSKKMIDQTPKDPRGYFVLSKVLARKTQYKESYEALEKAYQLNLKVEDILEVVDVLYRQKAYSWAKKACDLVLAKKESKDEACNEFGRIHEVEGNLDIIQEVFKKTAAINSHNKHF